MVKPSVVLCVCACAASAQPGPSPEQPDPGTPAADVDARPADDGAAAGVSGGAGVGAPSVPPVQIRLRTDVRHYFETGLDDSGADFSLTRWSTGVDLSGQFSPQMRWSVGSEYEASWYDFSPIDDLVAGAGDPLDRGDQFQLDGRLIVIESRQWSWFVGANIVATAADGADWGQSLQGGGLVGARYQVSPELALSFGIGGGTRLEEDPQFFPLLGVEWQIDETFRLASEGLGIRLSASLHPDVDLSVFTGWERREFRLDGAGGPLDDGVFRESRIPIEVQLEYRPTDRVELRFLGGVIPYHEYRFDDSDGDELAEERADPMGYIGFAGTIRF